VKLPSLYPIVNVGDASAGAAGRALALAVELAEAGASLLQLRAKSLPAGAFADLAAQAVQALSGSGCVLVVNDRLDIAMAAEAGGVHLGDEDLPVAAARRVLAAGAPRSGFLVGYSTHSVKEAAEASQQEADYLGFGPVFDSPTKAGVRDARGLVLLAEACRASRLPVVAIGGVTLENAAACWLAGAASVAVISEIERASDRRALVAEYRVAARDAGFGPS